MGHVGYAWPRRQILPAAQIHVVKRKVPIEIVAERVGKANCQALQAGAPMEAILEGIDVIWEAQPDEGSDGEPDEIGGEDEVLESRNSRNCDLQAKECLL